MIRRIQLHNFKAFKALDVPLGNLTLLSGLNSVGKSSALQAFGLLRQSAQAGMIGAEPQGELLLNGPLVQLGTARDVLYEWAEAQSFSLGVEASTGTYLTWKGNVDDLQADVVPATNITTQVQPEFQALLTGPFQYLRADRISPALVYPRSHQEVVRKRSLGSRGEFTVHYLSQHRDEPVENPLVRVEGRPPGLLSQVTHWMGLVAPGVRIEPEDVEGTDYVRVRFGFGSAAGLSGSASYRPTHVGFGLTYTLPVVVAALATPPGGTLLLENPEAHLHPRGQAALGRLLALAAAGGTQVVVESHSDHVLNGIRLAVKRGELSRDDVWLHFFRRTAPDTVAVESPVVEANGRLSRWPDGFFDQWDRDVDALLD